LFKKGITLFTREEKLNVVLSACPGRSSAHLFLEVISNLQTDNIKVAG
jgi:hypothetical protein